MIALTSFSEMGVGRIAEPADLAGLTAVVYSLTYLGFAAPVVAALLSDAIPTLGYPVLFGLGVLLAIASLVAVLSEYRVGAAATAEIGKG